jgi:uncharacterized protein YebE (UPF0316 family)
MIDWGLVVELLLILSSRVIEVSMGTLRVILINKGYRKQGVILALIEVTLWVLVASRVIVGINEQPFKAVVYCIGYSAGVYVGSLLECRLAFGRVLIQIITTIDKAAILADDLRSKGYGVTTVDAQGKDDDKKLLMIYANRKGQENIIAEIKNIDDHALIVSNEVGTMQGGYIRAYKRFVK